MIWKPSRHHVIQQSLSSLSPVTAPGSYHNFISIRHVNLWFLREEIEAGKEILQRSYLDMKLTFPSLIFTWVSFIWAFPLRWCVSHGVEAFIPYILLFCFVFISSEYYTTANLGLGGFGFSEASLLNLNRDWLLDGKCMNRVTHGYYEPNTIRYRSRYVTIRASMRGFLSWLWYIGNNNRPVNVWMYDTTYANDKLEESCKKRRGARRGQIS